MSEKFLIHSSDGQTSVGFALTQRSYELAHKSGVSEIVPNTVDLRWIALELGRATKDIFPPTFFVVSSANLLRDMPPTKALYELPQSRRRSWTGLVAATDVGNPNPELYTRNDVTAAIHQLGAVAFTTIQINNWLPNHHSRIAEATIQGLAHGEVPISPKYWPKALMGITTEILHGFPKLKLARDVTERLSNRVTPFTIRYVSDGVEKTSS